MPIVNLSEAARQSNVHRQQLQRMLKSGRLADHDRGHDDSGRQLIEVAGLRETVRQRVRRRIDSKHWSKVAPPERPFRRLAPSELLQWGDRERVMLDALNGRIEALVERSGLPDSVVLQDLITCLALELGAFFAALYDIQIEE